MKSYYVYILASRKHGTLYIGVTGNLARRMWQHRSDVVDGFTNRYKVHRLVYMEEFEAPELAIAREKSLKKWPREWKINLIERENPDWAAGTSPAMTRCGLDGRDKPATTLY